jgi:aminoglycoside 3-N-acetyltransferase
MIVKKILKKKNKYYQKYFARTLDEKALLTDLSKFGLKEGMDVFIHSSLNKLGNIQGGPVTVINSLTKVVGINGTILMPGFTIRKSMLKSFEHLEKNDLVFDYKKEIPLVGAIPRAFFGTKGVRRSIHPTHSVLAHGKNAEYFTKGHEICDSTFGIGTPLYKLIESDSYIMGLGSDLAHVTFYHVIEDIIKDFPVEVYVEKEFRIKLLINSELVVNSFKCHKNQNQRIETKDGAWVKAYFKRYFKKSGFLIEGKVGNADCWMIKAKDMYNCVEELLKNGITIYSAPPNIFLKLFYGLKWGIFQLNR